ncbi:hypothetical protein [Kiloniella antarctica]|uniref:Uncharacterized protein n=1 Tax=Kiloniella antarctica TaxID=1550907 RepID=A0ABW5BFV6_9PROT
MSLSLDTVSLSTGSGYGLPNTVAPVPAEDMAGQQKRVAKEGNQTSAAYEITLSEEAKALIARMEGTVRQASDVRFQDLSPEEQGRIRGLEKQLDEIFGYAPNKILNKEEKEQIAVLYSRMDDVLGYQPKTIDPMHHHLARRLEEEADRLLSDPKKLLNETEERQLAVIFSHLESLQGVSSVSYQVPGELKGHIAGLQTEVDQISGAADVKTPSANDMKQATQIFQDLAGIYDGAFRRMMKIN